MPDNCEHWQGLVAVRALRALDTESETTLMAHLATCADCRTLADEFGVTTSALAHARPENLMSATLISATSPAPSPERINAQIAARLATERIRHQRRTWSVGLAATAAAALIGVFVVYPTTTAPTRSSIGQIALANSTVDGNVVLENRPWGTQIYLQAKGFTSGQQYNVWLEQIDGTRIPAGNFDGVANIQLTVVLASSLPKSQAVAIGISEPDGTLIIRTPLT